MRPDEVQAKAEARRAKDKAEVALRLRVQLAAQLIGATHFDLTKDLNLADVADAVNNALTVVDILIAEASR